MEEKTKRSSLFWPVFLIVLGVFLFLNQIGVFDGNMGGFLLKLWPLLFIVGGLDGLYKREGYTGALVSIGIGTVFLLANLGYFQTSAFQLLLRLWPVLLIGWGFDLLLHSRTKAASLIGILIGLALIAGIVWLSLSTPFGIQKFNTQLVEQELGPASEGDITVVAPVGKLGIHDGAGKGNLVEGSIEVTSTEKISPEYSVSGKTGYFKLASEGASIPAPFVGGKNSAAWDLAVTSDVPVALSSQVITGEQVIDLTGLDLKGMAAETIIGSINLTLSDQIDLSGSANVVIGDLHILVPEGLAVVINLDTGLTSVTLRDGFVREGSLVYSPGWKTGQDAVNLSVEVPIGTITVEYVP